LFDIYVRDNKQWFESMVDLLGSTYSMMGEIDKIVQGSGLEQERKETSSLVLAGLAIVWSEFESRLSDLRDMNIRSESIERVLRDKIKALEVENSKLTDVRDIKSLRVLAESIGLPDIKELNANVERVLRLFEDNVKVMALREAMRTVEYKERDRSGRKSPRFIQEIDNEELVNRYKLAGYTLNKDLVEDYNKKYGITYNGLMERLKTLGAWKYKNKNKK